MMSHAGVAITITSVTNFMAFGIGASSSLPALRSFCMFASIGILTIFFFQVDTRQNILCSDSMTAERLHEDFKKSQMSQTHSPTDRVTS